MKKRISVAALISACVIVGMVSLYPVTALASNTIVGVSSKWLNLQTISMNMSYSGTGVTWNATMLGKANTVSMTASATLDKKNSSGTYANVATWSSFSTAGQTLSASGSTATSKGTYRLTVTVSVTSSSGTTETVSNSLEKTFS
ncbi:hypothetical protein FACS1894105_14190 [Clostridia bacterium]|nr:hypothetical protein FACS1894105_14190 [Clostridia bacterium]